MKKLLIAEDDSNLRLLYEKEFSEDGYYVILAKNAKEAISKAKREKPDLIVMDIRMPEQSGIEAMNEIKSFARKIPVILNTAYPIYKDDFSTWPAAAYVLKSADLSELKKTVNEAFMDK
ncbi:chemotaxis protein CheY [bacterium SM23_31]|nr:MAG: chemotaxis protein CheY [bacterium SM23_31]